MVAVKPHNSEPKQNKMNIDWNKDSKSNARYSISDSDTTCYVSEDQLGLPDEGAHPMGHGHIMSMESVARIYAKTYDHNGTDDTFAICNIEDHDDGEMHDFAFDGHGNFEWDTKRQG